MKKSNLLPTIIGLFAPFWVGAAGLYAIENMPIAVDPTLRNQMSQHLDQKPPEVVVLGNSITAAGVDEALLQDLLGRSVVVLTVPGGEAPAWYATLKNRVYNQGYRPQVVVVMNRVDGLISIDAGSQQDLLHLDELMDGSEPVLAEKVLYQDAGNPRWSHIIRRKTQIQRSALDWWRNMIARFTVGSPRPMIASLNTVFSDDNINYGLATIDLPAPMAPLALDVNESLLPDLLALTSEFDSRFVFAVAPGAPGTIDPTPKEVFRDVLAELNDGGGGFVDVGLEFGAVEFQDPIHLTEAGSLRYTTYLAEQLVALGIDEEGPLARAQLPYAEPTVSRVGETPFSSPIYLDGLTPERCTIEVPFGPLAFVGAGRLEALGLPPATPAELVVDGEPWRRVEKQRSLVKNCKPGTYMMQRNKLLMVPPEGGFGDHDVAMRLSSEHTIFGGEDGDLTWVYPGSSLVIESTENWGSERGPMPIGVFAHPFGGKGGKPVVVVNQRPPVPLKGQGGQLMAGVKSPAQDTPWRIEIKVPANGPFLAIQGLTLGAGTHKISFFNGGRSTELITLDVIGRMFAKTRVEYMGSPPDVPGNPRISWSDQGIGMFTSNAMAAVSDRKTGRCSPVAVLQDGKPLRRHTKCEEIAIKPGTQCHTGKQVRFHPNPPGRRSEFAVVYDRAPNATCATELWLLPGDDMEVKLSAAELAQFVHGPDVIEVLGEPFPTTKPTGKIWLRLRADKTLVANHRVGVDELERGVILELTDAVPPDTQQLILKLVNVSGVPVLVARATLVERVSARKARPAPVPAPAPGEGEQP